MLATLKETALSLRDPQFPKTIVEKSLGHALWYWTKYILLFTLLPSLFLLFILTYYVPQLSRLADDSLPDFDIQVTRGLLTTNLPQPQVIGSPEFAIVLDTSGRLTPDSINAGILVTSDRLLLKSGPGQPDQSYPLSDFGDFQLNKSASVSFLSKNPGRVWIATLLIIIVTASLLSLFFWLTRLIFALFCAALLWLFGRLFKRPLAFTNCLKLAIYALVLPLIISALTFFLNSSVIFYLDLGLFVFYFLSWYRFLTASTK